MRKYVPVMVAIFCSMLAGAQATTSADGPEAFHWPNRYKAAVSLSFDDARTSQMDTGLALLERLGVTVTFFVQPPGVEKRRAGWKQAVADGHEIGNHTISHPCTGNYAFSLDNALENYDLTHMARQIDDATDQIQKLLGVRPKTFAYPCGQKFVGRGLDVESYVPLVAERFIVGRSYLSESSNDPRVVDLAQAMGTAFDDMDFSQMKQTVDGAVQQGRWVIFVGHEIGQRGFQVTDTHALEELCHYLKDPANGIWLGTVEEIGSYVRQHQRLQ